MVFYESPYRLLKTLEQFVEVFGGDRLCCVSREISKLHETHHRGTLTELLNYFNENNAKGNRHRPRRSPGRKKRSPHEQVQRRLNSGLSVLLL